MEVNFMSEQITQQAGSALAEVAAVDNAAMQSAQANVAPLNYEAALSCYTEAERAEIVALSDAIDVRKIENVMNYGNSVLKKTFDNCGDFLKSEKGSSADQAVIAEVIELSKKASESYDDFNLVLQEPGFLQKFLLKLTTARKNPRTQKIQNSAVTSYKLLSELQASCDSWLDMLKNAYGEIECSAINDVETLGLLEKYIIAGKMAEDRVKGELALVQQKYQETGLQQYSQDYNTLNEGYKIFQITMANLEKSRVMYHLSIGQLALIKKSNTNVQISIHTQMDNSMALIGQQLRNAVLDAKTREVLEGQKAITRLNDELIKDVSKKIGTTAEETERIIYAGFYNVEAAKEAVTTVINSCQAIQKTASEMLPKMKGEMAEIDQLLKELEPCVNEVETLKLEGATNPTGTAPTKPSTSGTLKF